jgi:hypothetical protein
MDKREVAWRISQAGFQFLPARIRFPEPTLRHNIEWGQALEDFRVSAGRPVLLDYARSQRISDSVPALVMDLLARVDLVVEGSFRFFGFPAAAPQDPIDWNYDAIARRHWPDFPSHRIDHRVAPADAKWIWELNRLQHLPWLAQAWLFTGEDRYSQAAFAHLDGWIDQNPPGRGIAWRGAYEAGIRAISVAIALQGLRTSRDLTVARYRRAVTVLAQSASLCWRNRSLFSSANNHLVGEMAGMALVGLMFPELRNARDWERNAVRILSAEAEKQILADGAGAEQSVCYQVWTAELLNLVAALLLARDGYAPTAVSGAVERSAGFLASTLGDENPQLRYGDDDGGFALRLGPQQVRTVRDHLGIVGSFPWGDPGASTGRGSLDSAWFRELARDAPQDQHKPDQPDLGQLNRSPKPASLVAGDGGLVVLRDGQRRTTMDIGPLGYLSIAAHGHADALAVTFSEGIHEIISDPGTGSYYGHPEWRAVLRGTRAHPTVCVDDLDQSVQGGPFLWSSRANVRVLGVDPAAGVVDAEHDGYTRLDDPVVHRRWLIAPPGDSCQLVVDLLTGRSVHHARVTWPLHPSLEVTPASHGHSVSRDGAEVAQLLYAASTEFTVEEIRGDAETGLGWWSGAFESREPSWWLSAWCETVLPVAIATLICPAGSVRVSQVSVQLESERIAVIWRENEETRSVIIGTRSPAVITMAGHDIN